MKITVLVASLATQGISRVRIIASLLSRHYEVEVLGRLKSGESIFSWSAEYPWPVVRADGIVEACRAMGRGITGDLVLANCVSLTSFGVGLAAKLRRRLPLILDMSEWETYEHLAVRNPLRRMALIGRHLLGGGWSNAHSFKYRYLLDHLTGLADACTVPSEFLKNRYGGVVLPHGVDTDAFDPKRFDKAALRRKWGIPADETIFFFGGNPQPRKGLEEIIGALLTLDGKIRGRLLLVGRDESHPYTRRLMEVGRGKVTAIGAQPFSLMPELLATADVVALPQEDVLKSLGYVPCKMFEAMAMEIPVISSTVGDIPAILDGCGYVVPADDPTALQDMIEHVLTHPDEARAMGRRARARTVERYSWQVMDHTLHDVVESVWARRRRGEPAVSPERRAA